MVKIWRFHKWGYPGYPKIDGLKGKTQIKMDDNWGYPHDFGNFLICPAKLRQNANSWGFERPIPEGPVENFARRWRGGNWTTVVRLGSPIHATQEKRNTGNLVWWLCGDDLDRSSGHFAWRVLLCLWWVCLKMRCSPKLSCSKGEIVRQIIFLGT